MLSELRTKPLLDGFRGAPRADVPSLARLIAQISEFAVACRDRVSEVELNPVIVHAEGKGCTIADALIVLDPEQRA
jgi:acetyltransferase